VILHNVIYRLYDSVFHFKNVIQFQSTRKCNFIYAHKKSLAFIIFKKLKNYQQHDVQISYTKCHLDCTINVEGMHKNPFTPLSSDHCTNFHKSHNYSINIWGQLLYLILSEWNTNAEYKGKVSFKPYNEVLLSLHCFHEACNCCATFCKVYQISSNYDKWFTV